MIDVSTRTDPNTGDVWVRASARTSAGGAIGVALYELRVTYLEDQQSNSPALVEAYKVRAYGVLERMLERMPYDHSRR